MVAPISLQETMPGNSAMEAFSRPTVQRTVCTGTASIAQQAAAQLRCLMKQQLRAGASIVKRFRD